MTLMRFDSLAIPLQDFLSVSRHADLSVSIMRYWLLVPNVTAKLDYAPRSRCSLYFVFCLSLAPLESILKRRSRGIF
jgi:hypothetical protein